MKIKVQELIWYIIGGILAAGGLVLGIFNLVGYAIGGPSAENWVRQAENDLISALKINLDFLGWGLIFIFLGAAVVVIALLKYAKTDLLEKEKAARRQQRLG